MADDKKMKELSDDELENAAGGAIYLKGEMYTRPWAATDGKKGWADFKTKKEAEDYARKRGWGVEEVENPRGKW